MAQAPAPAVQAPPKPPSRATAVEHIKVHGKSLEHNLEEDSPDRDVTVYLPPSYATDKSRRYPVVYLLHGYGGRDDTFNGRLATLPDTADKLAASGRP
jgi:enterochelin esterase-like enzyme